MTIKSKVHNYGHIHESSWPSQFGTGEKGTFHINKETGECVEGYPPPKFEKFGEAPQVIFDSMPKTYHQAAMREVESRSEWNALDEIHGTITFGSAKDIKPKVDEANERKRRKEELRKASLEALNMYKQNPELVKQKVAKKAEEQREIAEKAGLTKLIEKATT